MGKSVWKTWRWWLIGLWVIGYFSMIFIMMFDLKKRKLHYLKMMGIELGSMLVSFLPVAAVYFVRFCYPEIPYWFIAGAFLIMVFPMTAILLTLNRLAIRKIDLRREQEPLM